MMERNALYFQPAEEAVMFKRTGESEWKSSKEYDIVTELKQYIHDKHER